MNKEKLAVKPTVPDLATYKRLAKKIIISFAWVVHMDKFKIPSESRKHYKRIFFKTRSSIGCSPSIFSGADFNNKMKWLMIFRQSKKQIEFCDKLKSKEIVEERIGKGYTSKTYGVSDAYEGLDFDMMPDLFVLKCNHDSGSVWILNKSDIEHDKLGAEVNKKLSTNHGWNNGEWYYSYVPPRVYAEEYLEYQGGVPPDYKFHCSGGEVLCCQYIYERHDNIPKEIIIGPDGSYLGFQLDNNFMRGSDFIVPDEWGEMLELARNLSKDEIYIRIDLYLTDKGVRFGEFSWHPRSGNYKGVGQKILGSMIYLNRSETNQPIVND